MAPPIVNIAAPLSALAASQPNTPALIETTNIERPSRRLRQWTYRELEDQATRLALGLATAGVERGMRVVLMVPPSCESYALTFALFKLGAVIVLIDPGMGVKNLGVCLNEAGPEAFIGIPRAHLARVLLGWGKDTIRLRVTVGRRWLWGGWTLDEIRQRGEGRLEPAATSADEMAAILFTSGSTGVAKGAVYTHGIFTAQVQLLRTIYHIEPGEIDLPTFPLFGLFGPALGLTSILPEMDATRPAKVDPAKILTAIRHFGVTNLFGSPALLRRVGFAKEAKDVALPTLRRVISAGAPVPASVIRQFSELLSPGVRIHTPYGATEALPVATINSEEILNETAELTSNGKGVCVGKPIAGMKVRIIRISDNPVPIWSDCLEVAPGEIGEIAVSGPVVTRSYFNRPESTALHKIDENGTVWHRMGDVGYLDTQGRIWFCGRKSQRVVTPGETLFTIPCEGVFNAHPAVLRSALVGVPCAGSHEAVLCVELIGPSNEQTRIRAELLELGRRHPHTRSIRRVLFHPGFPVDIRHNAKIFREKLALWAARQGA